MTETASHCIPGQNDALGWQVVPPGHGADPSVSHGWAHVPPMMQTSRDEQVPASKPHFCALVEQASPTEKNAATKSRHI
jgi:murein endopeptidase